MSTPLLSVVIPTFNRATLLKSSLKSLTRQTLPGERFEVVVVDDGSADETSSVCDAFSGQLRLQYFRIENSGISAAKNLGVFASEGPVLFFFDDDDVADTRLLEEHLATHSRYPNEEVAVLGHTDWAPALPVSELMHYVTDVGSFLFSYGNLRDGQVLDFTYFWGGRSSCKRSLLVKRGVFRQEFRFGSEDIELGYRLAQFGLKVVYHRRAAQYMNRCVTYDEFCKRCEKQGRSQLWFSRMHPDPLIQQYCEVNDAGERWSAGEHLLAAKTQRVRELEAYLANGVPPQDREVHRKELHALYHWTFRTFKAKGIVAERDGEARRAVREPERVVFTCNICGSRCAQELEQLNREGPSCQQCGSSVRWRSIIQVLAAELFGENLLLRDFPTRRDINGLGLSDWEGYGGHLAKVFNYQNTFYHCEPRLDITCIDPELEGKFDFIVATDVFEHVPPPVSMAFTNVRRLLKPGGVFVFSVPFTKNPTTAEHFPDLHDYEIVQESGIPVLRNRTREGILQVYRNLIFHGGAGAVLEMRHFTEADLLEQFQKAGLHRVKVYRGNDLAHGIYWKDDASQPMAARSGHASQFDL